MDNIWISKILKLSSTSPKLEEHACTKFRLYTVHTILYSLYMSDSEREKGNLPKSIEVQSQNPCSKYLHCPSPNSCHYPRSSERHCQYRIESKQSASVTLKTLPFSRCYFNFDRRMEIFSTCKMTKRFPNGIRHQSTVWYDMKRYGLVRFDTVTSIFSQK